MNHKFEFQPKEEYKKGRSQGKRNIIFVHFFFHIKSSSNRYIVLACYLRVVVFV